MASAASDGNASVTRSLEEIDHKPRRKTQQKSNKVKDSPRAEFQDASASGSSGKKAGSSTYRRLGEDVKQVNMVSYMTLVNQEQDQ